MTHAQFSKRERLAIAIASIAFIGVSTLVHFGIGGLIESHLPHWAAAAPEQTPTIVRWGTLEHPTPTPTPSPTPTPRPQFAHPTHTAQASASQRDDMTRPPHVRSTPQPNAAGDATPRPNASASPDVAPSVAPSPLATASGSDTGPRPPVPATRATFKHKVVPDYSRLCIDEGAGGTVTIDVTIDSDGSVAAAWVGQTSGFGCLDAAALSAAKESTYNPPEVGGRPVAETYLILYEFSIDS